MEFDEKETHQRDKEIRKAILFDRIYWQMLTKADNMGTLASVFQNKNLTEYNAERDFLEKQIPMEITFALPENTSIKIIGERKLKDLGAFNHLMKDRKVPFIITYYCNGGFDEVNNIILENELEKFDAYKILILKEMLKIDELIFKQLKKEGKEIGDNFRINFEKLNLVNAELQKEISDIRNKLLHNSVPETISKSLDYKDDQLFSESLYQVMAEKCQKTIEILNS